jgi:GNAT superfamily N-acetyltransferase
MIEITPVSSDTIVPALNLIRELLNELGNEGEDSHYIDIFIESKDRLLNQAGHSIFLAIEKGKILGLVTVSENFALYAGGLYGIINEMYVIPEMRSHNIGKLLLDHVKNIAKQKKWTRLDVTSPIEEKWMRTVKFYENQGFSFTGEKLKFKLRERGF